jgi:hypothetical protein
MRTAAKSRDERKRDARFTLYRDYTTVNRQRFFKRRAFNTLRPLCDDIRCMKPCTRKRGMRLGWYVRFISVSAEKRAE